ncbi:MAG: hypothetical protein ACTTKO_08465 [Candidatus Limimorpha sp.]
MIKKAIGVLFLTGWVILAMPAGVMAQEDYVSEELTSYYKELVSYDRQIVTVEDAERLETRYKTHIKLVESCYNDNSEFIRYDKKLQKIYENYMDLYQQIGKRIEELKAESSRRDKIEKLTVKFQRHLDAMVRLEEKGKHYVAEKLNDSLKIVKQKANEQFVEEASVEYGANRELFEESEELTRIWKSTKETYNRISALEIAVKPSYYDLIFKIVIVVAVVFFIINMISQKIKMKKLQQMSKLQNKVKKTEEDLPSI